MTTDFRQTPHPLLKEAVLYFPVGESVPWKHVVELFSSCGAVLNAGKHNNALDSKVWAVRFRDIVEGTPCRGSSAPHC